MDDLELTSKKSRLKGCTWEPFKWNFGDGVARDGYRLSNGRGFVFPTDDGEEWYPVWAHPDLCGRPGWHHHAFGKYVDAPSAMLAFEEVYNLEYMAGNTSRCDIPDGVTEAARIQALETSLAEAEGRVIAEVVAWLRTENGQCDCFARSEGECACGAWDDHKTKPLLEIATALETGEWKK